MTTTPTPQPDLSPVALYTVFAGAILAAASWLLCTAITLISTQTIPPPAPAIIGMARLPWHTSDPAAGFPPVLRDDLPPAAAFWVITILVLLLLTSGAAAVAMYIDALRGRKELARRPYDPRGHVSPRAFARPRDLAHLCTGDPDSFTMLRLDGQLIGSSPESHVLLIAPTSSGKTTGPVTTWTLEHHGPAIITSTKADIVHLTANARAAQGPVWIYAPGVPDHALGMPACGWTPLTGCENWEHAQMTGGWLASTPGSGDGEQSDGARFYTHEAGRLLAPLLHAAALGDHTMSDVNRWLRTGDAVPMSILKSAGADRAYDVLDGFAQMEHRARSLTVASAGQLIDAYEYETIARTDRRDFTPEQLLAGGTLYLVAPEGRQQLVGPLFTALLGAIFRAAEMHALEHQPLKPELRVILDEARHLAALDNLPHLLAVSRGWGVRIATVWQNLDQITSRYGKQTDAILGNSLAQMFLGPIRDPGTREYLTALLDTETRDEVTYDLDALRGRRARTAHARPQAKASAQTLQQLPPGVAILINGSDLPVKGRVARWWEREDLTRIIDAGAHVPARRRLPAIWRGR
ncbi:hypothetical protein DSM112329_02934 [Paraconexibacter sp. AEG42_29]|uniref:Type IV secretory system conjugative DNA transfer family protein n=1 Tax=Paraconexibacter sp. AEG42_29 TaxID=2997339 RepID=A0AAU7AXL9_9ACTN